MCTFVISICSISVLVNFASVLPLFFFSPGGTDIRKYRLSWKIMISLSLILLPSRDKIGMTWTYDKHLLLGLPIHLTLDCEIGTHGVVVSVSVDVCHKWMSGYVYVCVRNGWMDVIHGCLDVCMCHKLMSGYVYVCVTNGCPNVCVINTWMCVCQSWMYV